MQKTLPEADDDEREREQREEDKVCARFCLEEREKTRGERDCLERERDSGLRYYKP